MIIKTGKAFNGGGGLGTCPTYVLTRNSLKKENM